MPVGVTMSGVPANRVTSSMLGWWIESSSANAGRQVREAREERTGSERCGLILNGILEDREETKLGEVRESVLPSGHSPLASLQ